MERDGGRHRERDTGYDDAAGRKRKKGRRERTEGMEKEIERGRSKVQIVLSLRLPGNALISPPSSLEWILNSTL